MKAGERDTVGRELEVLAIGQVTSKDPFEVDWNGKGAPERMDLVATPEGFADLAVGSWVEAEIVLDSRSQCLRVLSFRPTDSFDEINDEIDNKSFQTMEDLPKGDWKTL
jgi:hypothetical protein